MRVCRQLHFLSFIWTPVLGLAKRGMAGSAASPNSWLATAPVPLRSGETALIDDIEFTHWVS